MQFRINHNEKSKVNYESVNEKLNIGELMHLVNKTMYDTQLENHINWLVVISYDSIAFNPIMPNGSIDNKFGNKIVRILSHNWTRDLIYILPIFNTIKYE